MITHYYLLTYLLTRIEKKNNFQKNNSFLDMNEAFTAHQDIVALKYLCYTIAKGNFTRINKSSEVASHLLLPV